MNLVSIPIFGIGNQGKSLNVNAQNRTNLYIEIQQDAEKNVLTMYPTPGLSTFVNFGDTPIRGMYEKGNIIYAVHKNILYTIANDGTITQIGTLASFSGKVYFADNGKQIIITDGPKGYIYNTATLVFTTITDLDFPGANCVIFINGRFVVNKPNTGEFYISSLYDGLSWDALDFATAEADPDNIVRLIADQGQLIIFGDRTTEPWGDSGAQDFPFTRIGSGAIEWGLAAINSLTKFNDSLIFLRKNRLGQIQVAVQSGGQSVAVSTPEIDYILSKYSGFSAATGFAYMLSGHPFYQINFPLDKASWLYDGQSKAWSKLESFGGLHRADQHVQLLSKSYVSDFENGKLYRFDENSYQDDGLPIVREFTSRHQANGNFRILSQLWLELEAGTGLQTGQGKNPQVMMQISRDGGQTYGVEIWREFGAVGRYSVRAVFNRLGRARDWVFKFRITDPVKTVIIAAWGKGS